MNTSSPSTDPSADERASFWAARLDGSILSAADQGALTAWLAENPAHRTLLSHYCQFSADLELLLPALAASGAIDLPQETSPRRRPRSFPWVIGGALAAAALVLVTLWVGRPRTQFASIATAVAQRQTLTLADGTRAELNAQTSLQIEMGPTERRVRLASGEAFFTVTKDKTRPFIVETPAGAVRVTGTVFNVRADSSSSLEVL
ncbi:MAG: FecR domain-containing protein, partial [Opitutaceae bacterium]